MVKEEGAEIYTIEFEKGDDEYELKITRNSDQTITVGDIVLESWQTNWIQTAITMEKVVDCQRPFCVLIQ